MKTLYIISGANGSGKTIQTIGNNAVREAQRKSLENGIPNTYSKNGVIYYQLPDGTITMDNPFEKGELKQRLDELTKG